MNLADQIDHAIVELELLFDKAIREFLRDDFPRDWDDELIDADVQAQEARSAIGQASDFNEHVNALQEMLRRIHKHDDDEEAAYFVEVRE